MISIDRLRELVIQIAGEETYIITSPIIHQYPELKRMMAAIANAAVAEWAESYVNKLIASGYHSDLIDSVLSICWSVAEEYSQPL